MHKNPKFRVNFNVVLREFSEGSTTTLCLSISQSAVHKHSYMILYGLGIPSRVIPNLGLCQKVTAFHLGDLAERVYLLLEVVIYLIVF